MIRMTIHLTGVKQQLVNTDKYDEKTRKTISTSKKKIYNTVTYKCDSEDEGVSLMNSLLEEQIKKNADVKVSKYYFTNLA